VALITGLLVALAAAFVTAGDAQTPNPHLAAAKKEGKVVLYGSQSPDNLNDLGNRFKKAYGIDYEVVRLADNDLQTKLQAERDTGKAVGDVVTQSAITLVQANSDKNWYSKPLGPDFDNAAVCRTRASQRWPAARFFPRAPGTHSAPATATMSGTQ